ncbi:MAG: FecR domain-containing protein [Deltaproteobacteria bacterium]|nr:FecR domain-containing protein [Deltaproteobacteria bacterium]MBN2672476.1 FecR domain-containing protein [Deltaproteobacteria bacterium]
MLDNDFACRTLAEAVRGNLEETSREETYMRHERMFVSMATQQNVHRLKRKAVVVGAFAAGLAAAAALLISVLISSSPTNEFSFVVGDTGTEGSPGDWIETSTGETTEIRFSQGTCMRVEENGAARIVESNKEAVTIELSRGTVMAEVNGNKHTRWRVNAGPFTVTVLGTVFDVTWDAEASNLDVQVSRGKVLVQGAGLSEHGVTLLAGQHLAANGRTGDIAMNSKPCVADTSSEETEALMSESGESLQNEKSVSAANDSQRDAAVGARKSGASKSKGQMTWQTYYRNKQFSAAIAAAQRQGLAQLYRTADSGELWQLADAARNAGQVKISNDALLSLRNRFNQTTKAKLAAFIIGRSAMDASHSPSIAAQWFQTYLTESPSGSMAEEVHGRLMTIYTQTNRLSAAKRIASQYVSRYPQGLYINQAHQVLQK